MKEIRIIKTVEQTEIKFIADDGKEFIGENAEKDCREYERKNNVDKLKNDFDRLDAEFIYYPLLDWFNCDSELWVINLKNKTEYYTMIDYFRFTKSCYDIEVEMPTEFPCQLTVIRGYEDLYEYRGGVAQLIADTKKALAKLEG